MHTKVRVQCQMRVDNTVWVTTKRGGGREQLVKMTHAVDTHVGVKTMAGGGTREVILAVMSAILYGFVTVSLKPAARHPASWASRAFPVTAQTG